MSLIDWLDLFGVFVFAVSGSLSAGQKKLDLFGVMVIALVTALGGGTLRDVLLGNTPVLWIREPMYLWVCIGASTLTLLATRYIQLDHRALAYADALGLSVFVTLGVQVAQRKGVSPDIAILMGVVTGSFGGLIRDVLTNEIPMLLRREIYAVAAMLGASVYVLFNWLSVNDSVTVLASMAVTLIVRLLAIRLRLSIPTYNWHD